MADFGRFDLFVCPDNGNDGWAGRLAAPNTEKTDGPLKTLFGARARLRELTRPPAYHRDHWTPPAIEHHTTVWLRGGRHELAEPFILRPGDITLPVTFASYPGKRAVIDGGRRITGWREETVNGIRVWVAHLPDASRGNWHFRSLFVNGHRRARPRLPKEGEWYWMEDVPPLGLAAEFFDGSDHFVCREGDVRADWRNISDVDVVALHLWVDEHLPVASVDAATRTVRCTRRSMFRLKDDIQPRFAKYYVENVFEALREPGQWYLDRPSGTIYYAPMPGELPETTEVYAPRMDQLVKLLGDADVGLPVQFVTFRDITFRHTDSTLPRGGYDADAMASTTPPGREYDVVNTDYGSSPQAAANLGGALVFEAAHACTVERCVVEHVGWYAIDIADGCSNIQIVGNELHDLGGGGVRVNGSNASGPPARRTRYNRITDNHIHHAGRVFHGAVGVFIKHSFGNVVAHNAIHDLYYSGISVGWCWGFEESVTRDNLIEANHVHHLGFGWLSDMGGIYTLGVQPGTVIRGNLVHDVEKAAYGGFGIYLDEGSSYIVVENNVCGDTSSQAFHQHYGRENILRNNVFAFGREGIVTLGRGDAGYPGVAITMERNILLADGQPLYASASYYGPGWKHCRCDLNVLWDVSGRTVVFKEGTTEMSLQQWQTAGHDVHSITTDPGVTDACRSPVISGRMFPALPTGFKALDLSNVGPRSEEKAKT